MNTLKTLGFTLIELMVTVSIAAIVLTLGVPGFQSMIRSNRLASSANEFIAALNLARSEAINRGIRVTVRKTGAQWEGGWEVFTDDTSTGGTSGTQDGADQTLRVFGALPNGYTLRGNNNFVNFISFRPSGQTTNIGSFAICDANDQNDTPEPYTSRLITVDSVGRIRLAPDDDHDGLPEKNDGTELASCTSP